MLTEKELLSCGLPMYVCSLHEKECTCRLCSIAHVTVTWGCALQVTVSTSNSCRCPLQLFSVVAHWVAMRSWSVVRLNTGLEKSVEPPLASMCSLDKEKVFPRIDNAETSASRETTRSPARRFAARSLLVSCPPGTMVSSYRRSSLSLLAANSCGCLFGKATHSLVSCPSGTAWTGVSWERWAARFLLPLLRRAAICSAYAVGVSPTGVRQRHFFLW